MSQDPSGQKNTPIYPKGFVGPVPIHPHKLFARMLVVFVAFLVLGAVGGWYVYTHVPGIQARISQTAGLVPVARAADISTTTSQRVVSTLTIADTIPKEGKFIAADLVAMKLHLYQDGQEVSEYPILTKGKPGSPFETPSGFYQVLTKEKNHLSTIGNVYMPYSMQFYGNYFIHGWPYYPDGTPVATSYSGGCIRLSTSDAAQVFAFADTGTKMFVYDSKQTQTPPPLPLASVSVPSVSAQSYLVADIDTGEVYVDHNAGQQWPIASVTKLMTALVANETINFERHIPITSGNLMYPQVATSTQPESVLIGKLFYPLLMESNNAVAHTLSSYYGDRGFVSWMNSTAVSLDMASTTFADASGESPNNISTVDDLYRLAVYLANKKSFILKISRTPAYTLTTESGDTFDLENFNVYSDKASFLGGKVGQTTAAGETMMSLFNVSTESGIRRIAVIVLQSKNYTTDTNALLSWFTNASVQGAALSKEACASCAGHADRRIIQL